MQPSTPIPRRLGGSFAPPINHDRLDEYRRLADTASRMVKDEMHKLCEMVETYLEQEPSTEPATPHPVGAFAGPNGQMIQPPSIRMLSPQTIQRLDELVPWDHETPGDHPNEIEAVGRLFECIQQEAAQRNSATMQVRRMAASTQTKKGQAAPEVSREGLEDVSLRNAAFHLLWYAVELGKDREPLATDKLGM